MEQALPLCVCARSVFIVRLLRASVFFCGRRQFSLLWTYFLVAQAGSGRALTALTTQRGLHFWEYRV